jgi:ubiquinone/menaquinone biosynthesis C-methylase UbiE
VKLATLSSSPVDVGRRRPASTAGGGGRELDDDTLIGSYYESAHLARALVREYVEESAASHFYRARMARIVELLASCPGGRLLDVGCGAGQLSRLLLNRRPGDFDIVALDRSATMIDAARVVIGDPSVSFVVARAESMPFGDGEFDVVLAVGVLEYTRLARALLELARVTRVGGLAVVTMLNPVSPYRLWERAVYRHLRRLRGREETPIRWLLREHELVRALDAAGFSRIDTVYYDFNLFPSPLDKRLERLELAVARRLERQGRGRIRTLGTGYIVAVQREG